MSPKIFCSVIALLFAIPSSAQANRTACYKYLALVRCGLKKTPMKNRWEACKVHESIYRKITAAAKSKNPKKHKICARRWASAVKYAKKNKITRFCIRKINKSKLNKSDLVKPFMCSSKPDPLGYDNYKKIPLMKEAKSCWLYSDLWRCYVKRVPKKDQQIYKLIVAQIKLWRSLYKRSKKNKHAKKVLDKNCKASVKIVEFIFRSNSYAEHCKKYVTGEWPRLIMFENDIER